jgi:hypothetical protein
LGSLSIPFDELLRSSYPTVFPPWEVQFEIPREVDLDDVGSRSMFDCKSGSMCWLFPLMKVVDPVKEHVEEDF